MTDTACYLCGSKEWLSVDYLRSEAQGMAVCKSCGLIVFHRWKTNEEYEAYYATQYRERQTVNMMNLVTTNRKLGYHEKFLGDWLKEKTKDGKKITVGEIGSATGYFLRWMRDIYKADVCGTELLPAFRRYAKWAFDISLAKEFDYSRKYDLVALYHVLEHIPDPKEVLLKLKDCIAPGGVLYLTVPVWMEEMMKWGGGAFTTFDDHFHPDHVNAWSKWHFKKLLKETGWKIVKENPKMYGYMVLLEPVAITEVSALQPPKSSEEVVHQLTDMKRAAIAYQRGDFGEAMRLYPRFVDAYLAQIGQESKSLDRQMELIAMGTRMCPNTILFEAQRGLILYQYGRLDEAEKILLSAVENKPHDDNLLLHIGLIYLKKGDCSLKSGDIPAAKLLFGKAVSLFDKLIGINPGMYQQCYDFIGYIFSTIPLDEELSTACHFTAPAVEGGPRINLVGG